MKLLPPRNHELGFLGEYIAYPLGKISLRILTLGRYPPEDKPHNAIFVAFTPWWLFGTIVTLLYS